MGVNSLNPKVFHILFSGPFAARVVLSSAVSVSQEPPLFIVTGLPKRE